MTCLALGIVLSSTAVRADPIHIDAGALFTGGDDTGFSLFSPNFSFMTSRVLEPIVNCAPCAPGSSFDVSTTLSMHDWAGSATVDGQTYDSIYFSGLFNFVGGSVIVPDMPPGQSGPDNEGLSRDFTGFTFTGTLAGFADPGLTGTPLFSTNLSGGGLAAVAFSNFPAAAGIRVAQLDYELQSAAVTPEPGSLLLLGSGAAWMGARWRVRRRL
jgi:hypothetical protein